MSINKNKSNYNYLVAKTLVNKMYSSALFIVSKNCFDDLNSCTLQ